MAISFIQYKVANNGGSAASITATFTNPIASGSIIAALVITDTGITSYTFSNDKGDSPTADPTLGIVTESVIGVKEQCKAFLTATTGAQAVTVAPNINFGFAELVIWEIAGLTGALFDKAVTAHANGPLTTSPDSGPTGTLSASAEAAIGYGVCNDTYTAAGTSWSLDEVTSFGNIVEHRVVSSNTSINATATTRISIDWRMWCYTFMSGSAPAATTIGWSRPSDPERPGPIKLQSDARSAFVSNFRTARTTTGIVWPTGEDRERLPPIKENADPAKQWFARSPNPVPTTWLPKIQTENRERELPPVRRPDEPFTWFYPSQHPVPQRWLPKAGGGDVERIFPIKLNPDEAKQWFRPSQIPVPQRWQMPTGADVERPPPIKENPDPAKQWFARSPNPVPITWLPTAGGTEHYYPGKIDQYGLTWAPKSFVVQSTISGIAWWRPADDARLVTGRGIRSPDEATPWFTRSPNPVPITWLPTAGETEHPQPFKYEDRNTVFAPRIPPTGTISGMAWWIPQEQIPRAYPGRTDQYGLTWAPQTFAVQSTIAGMAWWRPADDARLVALRGIRSPDEATPYFARSPHPVPTTWFPMSGENRDRDPNPYRRPDESFAWFVRSPVPVSGIPWWSPAQVQPTIPTPYWMGNPPWPFPLPPPSPVVSTTIQIHPFFATMGQLRGF